MSVTPDYVKPCMPALWELSSALALSELSSTQNPYVYNPSYLEAL